MSYWMLPSRRVVLVDEEFFPFVFSNLLSKIRNTGNT